MWTIRPRESGGDVTVKTAGEAGLDPYPTPDGYVDRPRVVVIARSPGVDDVLAVLSPEEARELGEALEQAADHAEQEAGF